jgi:meso-butanediol dehydrogenase / (S,S)-butanediol dehydrogenase / diacetyl reductase
MDKPMTSKRFAGKVVLVTGAASGIGKATAKLFAAEGADLMLADINVDGVRGVAAELAAEHGVKATGRPFNAADPGSCRELVDSAVAALGKLDVVANIAGIMDWGPLETFTEERWHRMMRINLDSVFFICQRAMPHLVKTRGNIVNISSAAGLLGIAYTTAYCASKAGVVSITKSLAVEFASAGVRVNAICPGGVRTPMNAGAASFPEGVRGDLLMRHAAKLKPLDFAEPEDIGNAVLFLASDDARFASGTILSVDGAQTAG